MGNFYVAVRFFLFNSFLGLFSKLSSQSLCFACDCVILLRIPNNERVDCTHSCIHSFTLYSFIQMKGLVSQTLSTTVLPAAEGKALPPQGSEPCIFVSSAERPTARFGLFPKDSRDLLSGGYLLHAPAQEKSVKLSP